MSRERKGLLTFLLLTFALTWAVELGITRRHEVASVPYILSLVGVMFVPGLSALFVRLAVERRGFADAGLGWGRGRYYLAGWLVPVGFGVAAMGLAVWLHQAEFDPWMTQLMVQIRKHQPGIELPPFNILRVYIIAGGLTQAVAMNFIPCLGEEFGWRGYLLMRLLPLGAGRAAVLTGAIWGLWHAPIILQGHNYPDHPVLGVPLMVGFCILLGVVLGWLRLASGSVFPVALGHAAVNGPGSTPLLFLRARSDITTGLTGLLGQAVILLFVLVLWRLRALRIPRSESKGDEDVSGTMSQPRAG